MHRRNKPGVEDSTALANILESLDIALIRVDAQRRVRFTNRLAEHLLKNHSAIAVQHGRVRCADAQTTAKLDNILRTICRRDSRSVPRVCIAIPYNHHPKYVTALAERSKRRSFQPEVLLAITDAKARPASREQALAALFGLTPAEIRVAMLMLAGFGPKEISQQTSATLHTVRFQLKAIYHKTDTTRQSQLVRLISMLPGETGASRLKRLHQTVNHFSIRRTTSA